MSRRAPDSLERSGAVRAPTVAERTDMAGGAARSSALQRLADPSSLPDYRSFFLSALLLIVCLLAAGFGWAAAARLDSAVVKRGVLVSESDRKTVEHLEGGILRRLLVARGDAVLAGQVVALLDPSQSAAQLAELQSEASAYRFELWRLAVEASDASVLDEKQAPDGEPALRATLSAAQTALFRSRRRAHESAIDALEHRIAGGRAQIEAGQGQLDAIERRLALLREESAMIASLVSRDAVPRQRQIAFDREIAEAEGDRIAILGAIAEARAQIAQVEAERSQIEEERMAAIVEGATTARRALAAIESRIESAVDIHERLALRAPQDGVVVDIRVVTPGAILSPGQPLMDILPSGDRLIAEVRLAPDEIDSIHAGMRADVRLIAFRRSDAPVVRGGVSYVSADLLRDERTGEDYYTARIVLDEAELAKLEGFPLTSGMPIEAAMATGQRRALDYFVEPLLRHTRRALTEK